MTAKERAILDGWVVSRKTDGLVSQRTENKQRHLAYKIIGILHEGKSSLDKAQGEDFEKVAAAISQTMTQNSRQSFITQLKSMVKYIQKERVIQDVDRILDVKAGSPSKKNKGVLSHEQWENILNATMSSKERAYLAMLYDGYHRPYEPYTLKWSDLQINEAGAIEYKITFKTQTERIIVQKPETTAILEMWKKESGHNYGDDAYIFPDNHGGQYSTLMQAIKLFRRLQKHAHLKELKPSSIRNTAITHDVNARLPLQYISMRAWGEPYNDMINIYVKAQSAQMQVDQHALNGHAAVKVADEMPRMIKTLRECPSCKRKNAMDGSFCIYCGANLDGQTLGVVAELQKRIAAMEEIKEFEGKVLAEGAKNVSPDEIRKMIDEGIRAALKKK